MSADTASGSGATWRRPKEGAVVSGVALVLARKSGFRVGLVRALFVLASVVGLALAVAFALFDHPLLGRFAEPGQRLSLIGAGLFLLFLYPLLALLLPTEERPRRWDFGSAMGAILLLAAIGQAMGVLLSPYWHAAKDAYVHGDPAWFVGWIGDWHAAHGWGAKEAILGLFFLSAGGFLLVERRAVVAFFRSMHVGVSLVVLTTLAVTAGVLVPQIDGFEDPDQRVDLAREARDFRLFQERGYQKLPFELQDGFEQYEAFRWAEGYFVYHMLHLYGLGMPEAGLTPSMEEGLDEFGERYGKEERDNTHKQMLAAFSGQEKVKEIGAFIHRHEPVFWRGFEVATVLDLNRTYKSHWFAALLWCLATSVSLSAYKHWRFELARLKRGVAFAAAWMAFAAALKAMGAIELPWREFLPIGAGLGAALFVLGTGVPASTLSLQKLGFFTVHNGMLVLLLGGLVSKLFTDRGILNLFLGQPPQSEYFRHYDTSKRARMPFSVELERFARQEWKALRVWFIEHEQQGSSTRPPSYTLWDGRTIDLDYIADDGAPRPRLQVRVDRLYDRVEVGEPLVSEGSPDEPLFPLAELELGEHAGEGRYMTALTGRTQSYRHEVLRDPSGAYRLGGAYGDDPLAHFPGERAPIGVLEVTVVGQGDGAPRSYAVHLGEELVVQGGYRIAAVDATTDFHSRGDDSEPPVRNVPLEREPRGRAAVWVDIVPPDGERTERRVVVEDFDAVQTGRQEDYFHSKVVLRFLFDDWSAPGPPRYLLAWRGDDTTVLVSESGDVLPAEVGKPLPLPGSDAVVPRRFFERAHIESDLRFLEPRFTGGLDEDFYHRGPRGAELTVTLDPGTAEETRFPVRLSTDAATQSNLWYTPDGRIALEFFENIEGFPFEWRSVLAVHEDDGRGGLRKVDLGEPEEREIRVNDYLYYAGYRFFQSNADPREPTYSGIGVVYDPGIPFVLLGMYTIIAGTAVAFLLRPVVLRRRIEVRS
jgi:phage shock protein PspC (stress-responsive transcriptional regulator)